MDDIYYQKGVKYFYGNGVRKDLGKAAYCFKRAADLGSSEAMYMLGEIFLIAKEDLRPSDITWFTREDEVYKDVHRAFYWFRLCYERSNFNSGWGISDKVLCERLHSYGFGLNLNKENHFEFFLESIKLPRREEIMYQIGKKYFQGINGNSKDIRTALFWFMEAAKNGSSAAARMLGEIYLRNEGRAPDIESAVYWYRKSNECDYLKAMYRVGKMYRDGIGLEKNLEQACYYLEEVFQNLRWSVL